MKLKIIIGSLFAILLTLSACVEKEDLACARGGNRGYKDFQEGIINYTEYFQIGEPNDIFFDSLKTKLNRFGITYQKIPFRTEEIKYDSINCYYETQNRYLKMYFGENFIDSIKQSINQKKTEENIR